MDRSITGFKEECVIVIVGDATLGLQDDPRNTLEENETLITDQVGILSLPS